ncbi:hypothetical protein QR680_017308 [Steinernema hermaphroditum]|uniref:Integral membrane protein 2 n=1 Tax=Steinernema hermaphroditum TaxID=289476 RepID=A0AA39HG32_9BILA|nr:hypothetical protein QR680_017308 [Steinernema hermaphroditum]
MNGPPIPLTVLTVEQKNMLADETNPTIFGGGDEGPKPKPGMSPRSRTPQKPYLPKANNIITVLSGILFYKHFSRQPTYFGWCGAKFVENGRQERLTQRLEIDPEENITAIVDLLGKRCFIKPLDRNLVAPPKSFIDLVEKLERGYYEQNPRVIHETYRVGAHLNMDELLGLESPMVARQCLSYDVFALEPASRSFESAHYFVRSKRRNYFPL